MTVYAFRRVPFFSLEFDPERETVITWYRDGKWTGGGIVKDDPYHAERLGITPLEHRLQHELAHHLVGFSYFGRPHGSDVLWHAAHFHDVPFPEPVSTHEEWLVTALQYFTRDVEADATALVELGRFADVPALSDVLRVSVDKLEPRAFAEFLRRAA